MIEKCMKVVGKIRPQLSWLASGWHCGSPVAAFVAVALNAPGRYDRQALLRKDRSWMMATVRTCCSMLI